MEQEIKHIVETIFNAAHIDINEIVVEILDNESKLLINIQVKEASLFIGKKGDVLRSFDLLFRAYIQNKTRRY
jgi:predicted RNA-binding protein Jag